MIGLMGIALLVAFLFHTCQQEIVHAHMENPQACAEIPAIHHLKKLQSITSEDGRDLIDQYDIDDDGQPDLEAHYVLTDGKRSKHPLSVWLHNEDADGPWYDTWYLDPRGNGKCIDILKFQWGGKYYMLVPLTEA